VAVAFVLLVGEYGFGESADSGRANRFRSKAHGYLHSHWGGVTLDLHPVSGSDPL